jgi:hypothetical protein
MYRAVPVSGSLTDTAWEALIAQLTRGSCTVVVGAGASVGVAPMPMDIAKQMSERFALETRDAPDLPLVAQFGEVRFNRDLLASELASAVESVEGAGSEAHSLYAILGRLPVELYITATYDNALVMALRQTGREPITWVPLWRGYGGGESDELPTDPTADSPLVLKLLGDPQVPTSLVLSRDDYFDVLGPGALIESMPSWIRYATATRSLVIVGLSPLSLDFQLVRRLLGAYRRTSRLGVITLLPPDDRNGWDQEDLARYVRQMRLEVYWGTPAEFAQELEARLGQLPI